MSIYNMEFYRREQRSRLTVKVIAWLFRNAAAVLLLTGFGALLALAHSLPFTLISIAVIIAGVWGQHHLSTRH